MDSQNFTTTFTVEKTPEEAFAAITNVRGWWSGEIDGSTDKLGEEFTYRYQDIHSSTQRITEFVPAKKVVWLVVDSCLNFATDTAEWTGTEIAFDISRAGEQTEVRFTHVGLAEHECFEACSSAWSFYIDGSLKSLIATGDGQPNEKGEGERASASL
jgi:hypothetical protein